MQQSRTIIHIGIHKTASTFLQTKVFPHFRRYVFLTRPYTQHNWLFNKLQFADDTVYDADLTARELHAIGENLLISDESFSGISLNCSIMNRSIIARRFSQIFPDATIILFIRGQQDTLISNYNNYVEHMRRRMDIHDFFWYPENDFKLSDFKNDYYSSYPIETLFYNNNRYNLHLDELKYYSLIRLYKQLFKNVHVFLFEDFQKDQARVLNRLAEIAGDTLPGLEQLSKEKPVFGSVSPREHMVRRIENFWLDLYKGITSPRYYWWIAKGIGLLCKPFVNPGKVEKERAYVREKTRDHYVHDNDLIIEHYPEVGIQAYPEKYRNGSGNASA
jgi:hypothetical protein